MLKTVYEKWDELKSKVVDPNENYIAAYYLGMNVISNLYLSINQGKMITYIEFTKEVLAEFVVPNIKGMNISVTTADFINQNKKYIRIENDTSNEDIFIAFTSSLADILISATSYYDAYDGLKKVVKEYKDYFSNPNFSLTKDEEQGLCAELIELAKAITKKGEKVILNWQGPFKNKRDFVFEKSALEVKSTSKQINTSVKISNENQMDCAYPSNLEKLFLSVYIMEDDENGFDVISCANDVINLIASATLRDAFKITLLKLKINLELYKAKYKFSVQLNNYYVVGDDFPKITKSNIDSRIYDVSYRVKIDELQDFCIMGDEVYEQF